MHTRSSIVAEIARLTVIAPMTFLRSLQYHSYCHILPYSVVHSTRPLCLIRAANPERGLPFRQRSSTHHKLCDITSSNVVGLQYLICDTRQVILARLPCKWDLTARRHNNRCAKLTLTVSLLLVLLCGHACYCECPEWDSNPQAITSGRF